MTDLAQAVDLERDHTRGSRNAEVHLVSYTDFQCPVCAEAHEAVTEAREALGERLLVVFRHLPVPSSHPQSVPAALAAEAAGEQGAFWEMHDRLFAHPDRLARQDLLDHAEALGLDVDAVAKVIDDELASERIEEDVDTALRSGVRATPGFFIAGRALGETWHEGGLLRALRRALGEDVEDGDDEDEVRRTDDLEVDRPDGDAGDVDGQEVHT